MIKAIFVTSYLGDTPWQEDLDERIADGYALFAAIPGDAHHFPVLILHKPSAAPVAAPAQVSAETFDSEFVETLDGFKAMVSAGDFVVLDTETTGLHDGEICQIAIVNSDGTVLLDTLVKTTQPIPADATRIHGITDAMVADAPSWEEVQPQVRDILRGREVIIYNAVYDRKMMHRSDERSNIARVDYKDEAHYWCAMEMYAEHIGNWSEWHQSYTWVKLSNAALNEGVEIDRAHTALGDCMMTLAVVRAMAKDSE